MSSVWGSMASIPVNEMHWGTTTRDPNSELDRNAFLNLLITQLRHQDPLNPMDDRDFISQMAQFSTLEQMQNLNTTFERTQAFTMIGRAIDAEFPHPITGDWVELNGAVVMGVTRTGNNTFLTVIGPDGNILDVPLQSVSHVGDVTSQMNMPSDLIGRYVQAIIINNERAEFIEGQVTSVKMQGNQVILVVGTQEVFFPHEVHSVSDRPLLIGSSAFTHGPAVTGVEIENNQAFLIFSNGARVRVDRINQATEASEFVRLNQEITYRAITGTVESVTIQQGIPFLNVRQANGDIRGVSMIDFLRYRQGVPPLGGGE